MDEDKRYADRTLRDRIPFPRRVRSLRARLLGADIAAPVGNIVNVYIFVQDIAVAVPLRHDFSPRILAYMQAFVEAYPDE